MPHQAYVSITGAKQGQFKDESVRIKSKDHWIAVLSFSMGLRSPRDSATGQASGKRQYQPVTIVKSWGAASPQGLTACATNEVLTHVVFEFVRTDPKGADSVYQTVTLTNALLTEVFRFRGDPEADSTPMPGTAAGTDTPELERWSFVFQKIEVADNDGQTSFADDWSARP